MLVRVLGPIEVRCASDRAWVAPTPQQRTVLALLVAHLGHPCRADRLVDALWSDDPPPRADRLVQGLISRLRRRLDAPGIAGSRIGSVPGGWQLDLDDDHVDACWFEDRVQRGRVLADRGRWAAARRHLEEALALWRDRPFGGSIDAPALLPEVTRLEEVRLGAVERLLEVRLRSGEHDEVVPELQQLVDAHPLRERMWALLMEALYASGRQADALTTYRQVRDHHVTELGTEPGPELQRLHQTILHHDPTPHVGRGPEAAELRRRRAERALVCRRDLPFVERNTELEVLHRALARLQEGRRQLALVAGEPGTGKTRLAAEFADLALEQDVQVLVGRCARGGGTPFQPFVEALRADVETASAAALGDRPGPHTRELARLLPELASHLGGPPDTASVSAELDQQRLFDAVVGWLDAAARAQPLALIVEDLHDAAETTLLMLRHVVRTVPATRLLVVSTYRDTAEELSPELIDAFAEWANLPDLTRVNLAGLSSDGVGELVAAAGATPAHGRQQLVDHLHRATAGNPLFVQELLAALPPDGRQEWQAEEIEVPWSLRQLLESRVQRLSSATVELVQHAAVAGERFGFATITEAASLDESTALHALEEAVGARLIGPVGDDGEEHGFGHAVMRAALLDAISRSRRMRLHARLAAVIERRQAADLDAVVSELAYHHAAAGVAGDPPTARRFTRAAGDAALAQRAYGDAVGHYRRALELLETDDTDPAALEERCDLLIALGEAQQRAGPGEHHQTLLQALRLATHLADPDRIARAAWADTRGFWSNLHGVDEERAAALDAAVTAIGSDAPGARATVLALLAGTLTFGGDRDHRRQLSDEALQLARAAEDDTVLARVLAQRLFTIADPDTLDERWANSAELIGLADRLEDPSLRVFSRWWRSVAAFEAGDRPEVDLRLGEARRLADELSEPFMRCVTLMVAANRELAWGELDQLETLADQYLELGQQVDAQDMDGAHTTQRLLLARERGDVAEVVARADELDRTYRGLALWDAHVALGRWEAGRPREALDALDQLAASQFEPVPRDVLWLRTTCLWAELAVASEHKVAAEILRDHLTPYATHIAADPGGCLGAVAHHLGRLATTIGDHERAQAELAVAQRVHERLGAERWLNRTRLARAQLLLARDRPGDRAAAHDELAFAAASARRQSQPAVARVCEQLEPIAAAAR